MWLKVIEIVLIFGIVFSICYEIVVPALTSRPLFPTFRKKIPKAEKELATANESLDVRTMKRRTSTIRNKINRQRSNK